MISFELKQIVTQIIAFLIMFWILKRYLWKPLMRLLDERTRSIQASIQAAEDKNLQADELKSEYEVKLGQIDDERRVIIQKAVKEGQKIASEIEQQAHVKAQGILHKAEEQTQREKIKAKEELRKEMIETTFLALEKLVKVKLSQEDRNRLTEQWVEEV